MHQRLEAIKYFDSLYTIINKFISNTIPIYIEIKRKVQNKLLITLFVSKFPIVDSNVVNAMKTRLYFSKLSETFIALISEEIQRNYFNLLAFKNDKR